MTQLVEELGEKESADEERHRREWLSDPRDLIRASVSLWTLKLVTLLTTGRISSSDEGTAALIARSMPRFTNEADLSSVDRTR